MGRLVRAFGLVWLVASPARADVVWTEVTTLAGKNPALAPALDGGVHIILADDALRHVELNAFGDSLGDEPIADTDGAASSFQFGPAVAVANGVLHVAFAREAGGSTILSGHYLQRSNAGWSSVLDLQPPTERGYSPSVVADSNGVAHILFGAATTVPFGVANYYRVGAGALTASHPALVEWRADDRTSIVAGPGEAIHAFGAYPSPNGQINLAYSANGGTAFDSPIEIQPANVDTKRVGQPHAVVDAVGTVHLVYGSGEEVSATCPECAVHYATIAAGAVEDTSVVTPPGALEPWHLSLGIARIGLFASGTRVVAWQAHAGDDTAAPVSASSSTDGKTWAIPAPVVADCGGSEGRNTIDVVGSGSTVWLACPKGSSTRIFRAVETSGTGCDPAQPFSGVSVTPSSGSGPSAEFVTRISHCEGTSAFRIVQLRVTKVVEAQEPAVAPSYEAGLFHLDAQTCTPGQNAKLLSTYGNLDCATSSVAENGNELAVTFSLVFDTFSFAGERGLFVDSKGGTGDPEPRLGWSQVGTWTVAAESAGFGGSSSGGSGGTGGNADRGGVEEDDGCGCRMPARSPSTAAVLFLLMALGFASRRCKR